VKLRKRIIECRWLLQTGFVTILITNALSQKMAVFGPRKSAVVRRETPSTLTGSFHRRIPQGVAQQKAHETAARISAA
jgi:hypothetical protein